MSKCKHKWIRYDFNTLKCEKCKKFAGELSFSMPAQGEKLQTIAVPAGRETMEVPFYTGSEHIRITVDKENFLKEMLREQGLDITHNIMKESFRSGI